MTQMPHLGFRLQHSNHNVGDGSTQKIVNSIYFPVQDEIQQQVIDIFRIILKGLNWHQTTSNELRLQ
jgi:hypothetical protein